MGVALCASAQYASSGSSFCVSRLFLFDWLTYERLILRANMGVFAITNTPLTRLPQVLNAFFCSFHLRH